MFFGGPKVATGLAGASAGGGVVVLAGMCLMALNAWKTFAAPRDIAPQRVLVPDAANARA